MTTEQNNRNRLDQELSALGEILRQVLQATPGFQQLDSRDSSNNLSTILHNWDNTFAKDMARCNIQYTHLDKVRRIRNEFAHHEPKYKEVELTNQDIRAVQDLGLKLHNFQSTIQSTRSHPGTSTSTKEGKTTRNYNYQHQSQTNENDQKERASRGTSQRRSNERARREQRRRPKARPTTSDTDTANMPIQTIGIFFGSLIVATLIGNQFLPLETSGTLGFLTAVAVTALAVRQQGFK